MTMLYVYGIVDSASLGGTSLKGHDGASVFAVPCGDCAAAASSLFGGTMALRPLSVWLHEHVLHAGVHAPGFPRARDADDLIHEHVAVLGTEQLLEVVELATREHDLAGDTDPGGPAVAALQHRALDLATDDRRLDQHAVIFGERYVESDLERGPVFDLAHPDTRSGTGRLHEGGHT